MSKFSPRQIAFRAQRPDPYNTIAKTLITKSKVELEKRARDFGIELDRRLTLDNMYRELYFKAGYGEEPEFGEADYTPATVAEAVEEAVALTGEDLGVGAPESAESAAQESVDPIVALEEAAAAAGVTATVVEDPEDAPDAEGA